MAFSLDLITELNAPALEENKIIVSDGASSNTIENIKLINVVIGSNNAGKSRLIRHLYSNKLSQFDSSAVIVDELIELFGKKDDQDELIQAIQFESDQKSLEELATEEIESVIRNNTIDLHKTDLSEYFLQLLNKLTKQNKTSFKQIFNKSTEGSNGDIVNNLGNSIFPDGLWERILNSRCTEDRDINKVRREYIPTLRGLRTLDPDIDFYRDRTIRDYFKDYKSEQKLNIFTGHSLYEDMVHTLLGSEEERASIKEYEAYLSSTFFLGKPVTIIPRKIRPNQQENNIVNGTNNLDDETNNVVHIKIGDEPQRAIYDLGDGIQAMICLTVRPFLEKTPTLFFIEEPEHNLHAGMQRALIDAFRKCPQHMFFFTTQSNHFVDLTLESDDINLISVKKEVDIGGKATSIVQSQANNNEVLKELGVLASSVLLANCSIWVEGVTDKRYLQVYLDKYLDELEAIGNSDDKTPEEHAAAKKRAGKLRTYNENLHYVFVEYQGSNITHWAFTDDVDPEETSQTPAPKISKDILLLADADIDTKGSRVEDLKKALGGRFELLDWKEIENYIPQDIIVKAAKKHWKSFQKTQGSNYDFDSLDDKYFENPKIGIGGLLEVKVTRSETATKEKGSYFYRDGAPTKKVGSKVVDSPGSGSTIRIKVAFCDTVVNIMKGKDEDNQVDWQLTPKLEGLCDRIWSFIEECN